MVFVIVEKRTASADIRANNEAGRKRIEIKRREFYEAESTSRILAVKRFKGKKRGARFDPLKARRPFCSSASLEPWNRVFRTASSAE